MQIQFFKSDYCHFKGYLGGLIKRSILVLVVCVAVFNLTFGKDHEQEKLNENKFIFVAHTYYVMRHPDLFTKLIEQIKEENAKYVFFLGDVVCNTTDDEWNIFFAALEKLKSKTIFVPGNHDVYSLPEIRNTNSVARYPQWKQEYIKRIGYDYDFIKLKAINFISINSNDPLSDIAQYFEANKKQLSKEGKLNVLLTHHAPWQMRVQYDVSRWMNKTWEWEAFKPYMKNINYVMVGDQWGHLQEKQLDNNAKGYYVGIGNNGSEIFYVKGTLVDNELVLSQVSVNADSQHPYYLNKH